MRYSWKKLFGFLAIILITCLITFAAWLGFVFYTFNSVTTHDEYWVEKVLERKKHAAEKRQGGRLIIVAGSSAWYGFRVHELEKELGIPVVNMAIHAGLSIDGVCSDALSIMRPGDAILMAFEYEQFSREPFQYRSMAYMLRNHPDLLLGLPPIDALRFVLSPPIAELGFRIDYMNRIRRGEDVYAFGNKIVSLTDEEGEITDRNEEYYKAIPEERLDKKLEPPNREAERKIAMYAGKFHRRGAEVFACFAPKLLHPEYDRAELEKIQRQVKDFYNSHGAVFVGSPIISTTQGEQFFDNPGHLTEKGALDRSRQVAGELLANPAFQEWLKQRPK
jgi:hypothetical protein